MTNDPPTMTVDDARNVVIAQGQRLALLELQIEVLSRYLVEARGKIAALEAD